MKQEQSFKAWDKILTGSIGLMILVGIFLMLVIFGKFDGFVKENVDNRLSVMADAVDKTTKISLRYYEDSLTYVSESEEFLDAERIWEENGNETVWKQAAAGSSLGSLEEIAGVCLMKEDEVLISMGEETFYFPMVEKAEGEMILRPCIGEDGTVYLALVRNTERSVQYAVLLNATAFFGRLAGISDLEKEDQVFFMDQYRQMLVLCRNGSVHIYRISQLTTQDEEFQILQFLDDPKVNTPLLYETVSKSTGESYQADLAAIRAENSDNGYLSVGVSVNYDAERMPLKTMAVLIAGIGTVFLLGIFFLWFLLYKSGQSSQSTMKEIRILKEKNAAIEELNRQTQDLAHHQRLEIMGILTSGIAHEFNNLLTPIMGYSMMILEKLPQDDTELYDEVLEIYQMSSKAKTVISRLSDLSGKNSSAAFGEVSIDELVRRMISASKSARPGGVDVQLELKCQEAKILGNETQLSQMLLNMILNSFHALEEKGGTLEILTEVKKEEVCLIVRDNGYGISKENLEHIFEPFFTTKEAGKGTGLGMAIVAQVVEDHHGKITVESVEHVGTEIFVSFPILNKY